MPKSFDVLFAELSDKAARREPGSATVARLDAGVHEIGKKVVEEAAEEISQLLYHLQVMMLALDLDLEDVYAHL